MARRFAKPLDVYKAHQAFLDGSLLSAEEAFDQLALTTKEDWIEAVSGEPQGRERLKLLRDLGHPFGRLQGSGKRRMATGSSGLPLLPIGVISGTLRASIAAKPVSGEGIRAYDVGSFGVKYNKYILGRYGTRKMVARGFLAHIMRRWRARNKAFTEKFRQAQITLFEQ